MLTKCHDIKLGISLRTTAITHLPSELKGEFLVQTSMVMDNNGFQVGI